MIPNDNKLNELRGFTELIVKKTSLIRDVLTGENDQGSSKKFIVIFTLFTVLFMAIYELIITGKLNEIAFTGLIGLIVAAAGLGIADKKLNDTQEPPKE